MVYLQRWHGWRHMKLLPSRRVLCTPYNHAPCHFMQSHIHKVYACKVYVCNVTYPSDFPVKLCYVCNVTDPSNFLVQLCYVCSVTDPSEFQVQLCYASLVMVKSQIDNFAVTVQCNFVLCLRWWCYSWHYCDCRAVLRLVLL